MNKLSQYSVKERDFIVDLGLFNYEKNKNFIEKSENFYKTWKKEDENKEILSLKDNIFKLEKEYNQKMEEKIKIYDNKLEKMEEERRTLINLFELNVKNRVSGMIEAYKGQIDELEKKNKYYYDLYVSKEKGTNYEEEIGKLLNEYNEKYFNNVWRISHVGQVLSSKGDYNMYHKDIKCNILLDMKNNLAHKPVSNIDMDKFIKDVYRKESNFVAGIMVANNNICTKRCFDFEKVNDKYLVYISNFDKGNIGFLYTILNMIIERIGKKDEKIDENDIKKIIKEQYSIFENLLMNNTRERKKIEANMENLMNKYKQYFNDDLELDIKKRVMSGGQEKSPEKIVDFDKLEKNRKIIGKRSKYWLLYDKKGEKTLQYFQSNHSKNKKIAKLDKKKENVIIIDTENLKL